MNNNNSKNYIIQYEDNISKVEKYKSSQIRMLSRFNFDKKIQKRFNDCADVLFFSQYEHKKTFEQKTELSKSYMCGNRFCDVCNYYRSRNIGTSIYKNMIDLHNQGKEFIFMTLTIENCKPDKLKNNIKKLAKSWGKFSRTDIFKRTFSHWFRVLEITANTDEKYNAMIHPHYHCILAVEPSYFKSKDYYTTSDVVTLWTKYLGQKQQAICDIRKIKADSKKGKDSLLSSVAEISKYAVKTADLKKLNDSDFETVYKSLKNVRFITTSRNIKLNESVEASAKIDENIWDLLFVEVYKFSFKTAKYKHLKLLVKKASNNQKNKEKTLKNFKFYRDSNGDFISESTDYRTNEHTKTRIINHKE